LKIENSSLSDHGSVVKFEENFEFLTRKFIGRRSSSAPLIALRLIIGAAYANAANTGTPHFLPKLLDFTNEIVGILASATSPPVSVKFINPRKSVLVTIKSVAIFGTDPADFVVSGTTYVVSGTTYSGMLTNGSTCQITLNFTLTLLGVREGTLTVKSDLGNLSIPLTGHGVPGVLKFSPATLSFGKQTDGVTSPIGKTVTITNGNPVALQVTQTQPTGSFQIQNSTCGLLNAGQTCTITLTVTPLCPVPESGVLLISNDNASNQQSVGLSVIGVANGSAPGPHVLIAGGLNSKGVALVSADLFDSVACRFKSIGSMSMPRVGHTATWLYPAIVSALGGQVLITGGQTNNSGAITASAHLYNPQTGKFTPTGAMDDPRANHSATLLTEGPLAGMVLVTGGVTTGGIPDATAELFNPSTGTFSFTTGALKTQPSSGDADGGMRRQLQRGRRRVNSGRPGQFQQCAGQRGGIRSGHREFQLCRRRGYCHRSLQKLAQQFALEGRCGGRPERPRRHDRWR
jgi:hypothetical protein